jgi:hypothetical protein
MVVAQSGRCPRRKAVKTASRSRQYQRLDMAHLLSALHLTARLNGRRPAEAYLQMSVQSLSSGPMEGGLAPCQAVVFDRALKPHKPDENHHGGELALTKLGRIPRIAAFLQQLDSMGLGARRGAFFRLQGPDTPCLENALAGIGRIAAGFARGTVARARPMSITRTSDCSRNFAPIRARCSRASEAATVRRSSARPAPRSSGLGSWRCCPTWVNKSLLGA